MKKIFFKDKQFDTVHVFDIEKMEWIKHSQESIIIKINNEIFETDDILIINDGCSKCVCYTCKFKNTEKCVMFGILSCEDCEDKVVTYCNQYERKGRE